MQNINIATCGCCFAADVKRRDGIFVARQQLSIASAVL